jgi:hypothetical protein
MPPIENNGSVYYQISCGLPSTSNNLDSNNYSGYYSVSANDFILWGQDTLYVPSTSNDVNSYYFLACNIPSDSGLDKNSNNGTAYYYNSAFNCVSFCDDVAYYSPSGLEWNG